VSSPPRYNPSPESILRAVDTQLQEYFNVVLGGVDSAAHILPELRVADQPGALVGLLISRYEETVLHGTVTDNTLLRHAMIVHGLAGMARTDRCSKTQLRATLALLEATRTPGYPERPDVTGCRAEIESELW
jgi:hypothetical protein